MRVPEREVRPIDATLNRFLSCAPSITVVGWTHLSPDHAEARQRKQITQFDHKLVYKLVYEFVTKYVNELR